jgi:hypothetical protein
MKRISLLVIFMVMIIFIILHSWFVINLGTALLVLAGAGILVYVLKCTC